ncbi:MAG TPA: amidase [Chloroflexia bacterium]|nr:amidase [Chloroflexia bacterium]
MNNSELCYTPATTLAWLIRQRQLSPVEVTEAFLARIEEINPKINAYCTVAPEQALEAARAAEAALKRGESGGLIHGVPVAIKDLTPTAGILTTYGSHLYERNVPKEDGLIVSKLKAAGAIILGKTNTPEFGAGANTFNDLFGPTRNPWRLTHTPAGSSGGAAASLAAGLCALASGSDLAGSLRTPASFCNVVGLRPTPGRVPVYPSYQIWNPLGVDGPMARTVADTALMLSIISGRDDRAPLSYAANSAEFMDAVIEPAIRGWRVAWSPDLGFAPVDKEVIEICEGVLPVFSQELGCVVEEATPPMQDASEIFQVLRAAMMVASYGDVLEQWRDRMQPNLVWNIEQGMKLSARQVGKAQVAQSNYYQRVNKFMQNYDLLVLPAAATLPFPFETISPPQVGGRSMDNYVEWLGLAYGITLAGLPSIVVPCGWSEDGLPVGIQIVGKPLGEAAILKAAACFEAVRPWANRRPEL